MKIKFFLLVCFTILIQSCNGQATQKRKIHNKDFNWTITIPENFDHVSSEEWKKLQNVGEEAIEKTYEEEVVNQTSTIFVFKSDQLNYFESNYQPFDTAIDGDYLESCKNVNELLYQTFKTQMPDLNIDSSRMVEKIDNLEFQTFKMKIDYPDGKIFNVFMFSRLFDKREFSVNILFVDELKGKKMLDSWKNSIFSNQNK